MNFGSTYSSKLFLKFREISTEIPLDIIRFYNQKEKEIDKLPKDEFFEVYAAYLNALFETRQYRKVIPNAEHLLQFSIIENLQFCGKVDVYKRTLFQKAVAYYQEAEYGKSELFFEQLLYIDPENTSYQNYYKRLLNQKKPSWFIFVSALGVVLYIISAILAIAYTLVVQPFYLQYSGLYNVCRAVVFGAAMLCIVCAYVRLYFVTEKQTKTILQNIRRLKSIQGS